MNRKFILMLLALVMVGNMNAAQASVSPYNMPGSIRQWAPSRTYRQDRLRIEVTPDFAAERIHVKTRLWLTNLSNGGTTISLDAKSLEIESVSLDGKTVTWTLGHESINIKSKPMKYGETMVLTIVSNAKPSDGFNMSRIGGDMKTSEFFTWGDVGSNSFVGSNASWFPAYHRNDNRCPIEVLITLPSNMAVICNANKVKEVRHKGSTTRVFRTKFPIPATCIALAGGNLVRVSDGFAQVGNRKIEVGHWIAKDKTKWDAQNLHNTAAMIELLSARFGTPYPWDKYDVVVVRDLKGGYSVPGCTFIGLNSFYAPKGESHAWPSYQAMILHEIVHSWFGGVVCNKNWDDTWLIEGSATYYAAEGLGFFESQEMFEWARWMHQERYADEDRDSYRRPLSTSIWSTPEACQDSHSYYGGATRFHLLKYMLGEKVFEKALHHLFKNHAHGAITAEDMRESIHEVSGQSMDQWFAAWVYGAGYPEIVTTEKTEGNRWVAKIRQVQDSGRGTSEVFPVEFDIRLVFTNGSICKRVQMNAREVEVSIETKEVPLYAVVNDKMNAPILLVRNRPSVEVGRQSKDASLINRLAALGEAKRVLPLAEYLRILGEAYVTETNEDVKIWILTRLSKEGSSGFNYSPILDAPASTRVRDAGKRLGFCFH
jgi:aminopeptidase N